MVISSSKTQVVTMGRVSVDSGHLMLTDPCYVLPKENSADNKKIWEEFLAKASENEGWNRDKDKPGSPVLKLDDGLVMAFPTGLGDGSYMVTAEIEWVGSWGWRTKSVTIHLLDDPDELDDEADLDDEEDE